MTEQTTDAVPDATPETAPTAEGKTFTQADVDRLIADRLKRAKPADYDDLKAAAKRLSEIEAANATDLERAVKAARDEGRSEVASTFGQRLASAEFVAAAARRNPGFDAAAVLDDLNLSRYVTPDGDPDRDGIAAAVERLIPAPDRNPRPTGDADLGPRTGPKHESTPGLGRLRDAYASKTP